MLTQHYRELSVGAVLVGVVLVLLSEIGHQEWARIFGAVLISIGGPGLGIYYGLHGPPSWPPLDMLRARRRPLALLVALILVVPVGLVFVAGLVGPLLSTARLSGAAGVIGLILVLAMLGLCILCLQLGVRSIERALRAAHPEGRPDGPVGETA